LKPVSGGPEEALQLAGFQRDPSVSNGVIAFASAATYSGNADVYVYAIATNTLLRVTDSPTVNESLSDVSVLSNGDVRVVWATDDDIGHFHNIYARTFTLPLPEIAVAPADVDFGDVNVGTTGSTIVTVSNVGDAPLSVSGVALWPTGGPFAITTAPALPATVAPGGTLDVPLAFSPTATGVRSGTLTLTSNDPDEGTVQVPFTGRGVVSQPPPSQQIANILAFFDSSVAAGTLQGSGPGNSAQGRLRALRNMIEAAGDLIRRGLIADACGQLADARNRTDGQPQPPDFVSGPAAVELRTRIETLRATLGCT
jgi:Abnormal spindle-like microcephaly-assoc'd, ASPM-SPD-2-Hydin